MLEFSNEMDVFENDVVNNLKRPLSGESINRNDYYNDHGDHEESNKKVRFEPPLYIQRYDYLCELLLKFKCKSILDIGCAECKLLRLLKNSNQNLNLIVGLDLDEYLLNNSKQKFTDNLFDLIQPREQPLDLYLIKGDVSKSNFYFLDKFGYENSGLDCVSLIEVIEHMYPDTLDECIETVFNKLKPRLVLITTPNSEYNVVFDELEPNKYKRNNNFDSGDDLDDYENESLNETKPKFRHWDHKFEWTRDEFQNWCQNRILNRYKSYKLVDSSYDGVGQPPKGYEKVGFCSQIACFINKDYSDSKNTENKFQTYLKEKRNIKLKNRQLNLTEDKLKQDLYIDSDRISNSYIESYKLIFGLSYPFEIYEFDNLQDRNQALLDELNYLITFLTKPAKTFNFIEKKSEHILTEEDQEKLNNNMDIFDDSIRLAKIDRLIDFNSIKKFKLSKEEILAIMKANGYEFTFSGEFAIHKHIEESESEEDEDEEFSVSYNKSDNDISFHNESSFEIENERNFEVSTFNEPEWDVEPVELISSQVEQIVKIENEKNQNQEFPYSVIGFHEEMWDQGIQLPSIQINTNKKHSLRDQFEDVDGDGFQHQDDNDIQKTLNFKFNSRSNKLRLADFSGYNYNSAKQKEFTYKLRSTFKKSYKELKNQKIENQELKTLEIDSQQFSVD